jgi:1,4-alpha-glucan branching enzyme
LNKGEQRLFLLVFMIKTTKRSKKAVLKVETAPAEAVKAVAVKAETPRPPRVVLELANPAAKQVFVAGSFNNWQPEQTPLAPAGDGRWMGAVKVQPGRHEYLFVVDGQWLPDPNARESVENPFGGRNSVLTVSG